MQLLNLWPLFPDWKAENQEKMQILALCEAQLFTATFWSARLEIILTRLARENTIEGLTTFGIKAPTQDNYVPCILIFMYTTSIDYHRVFKFNVQLVNL